jgi:large subunit ribosomal protein L22
MIRGRDVNGALAILRFSDKRAAGHVEKCMRSAIANANEAAEKANISIDPDDLWVKAAYVDRGPTKNRRRVRPAPQGRAYREQRHFCHVTILLSNDTRPEPRAKGNGKVAPVTEAKPAKLAESKGRKRGGAAAAPRAKRGATKAGAVATTKAEAGEKKKPARRPRKKTTEE